MVLVEKLIASKPSMVKIPGPRQNTGPTYGAKDGYHDPLFYAFAGTLLRQRLPDLSKKDIE